MSALFLATITVEKVRRLGIDHFFITPGSRSTPLVLAVHNQKDKTCGYSVHFDERAAAFAALGYARAAGKPAALICTSGSAVANYLPAVVEAFQQGVPLVVITADRPDELLRCGANQAIEQRGIFGVYVAGELHIPPAVESEDAVNTIIHDIENLYGLAVSQSAPVHINCQYREPFTGEIPSLSAYEQQFSAPLQQNISLLSSSHINEIASHLQDKKILIIAGRLRSNKVATAVQELATALAAPVYADITSQARFNASCICHGDALAQADMAAPDVFLHIGGSFISKSFLEYCDRHREAFYIHLDEIHLPYDPLGHVDVRYQGDIIDSCTKISCAVSSTCTDFARVWEHADSAARVRMHECISDTDLGELEVAQLLSQGLQDGEGLVLGASMSVRLVNLVAYATCAKDILVSSNRGASGIDGTIATAVGCARGWHRPVTLLLGDLSFLHDISSLALVASSPYPLRVVVLNNNGGGIFHHLPIAQDECYRNQFEELFVVPHHIDNFKSAAEQFDLAYYHPTSIDEYARVFANRDTSCIIEVSLCRETEHQRFTACMQEMIRVNLAHS